MEIRYLSSDNYNPDWVNRIADTNENIIMSGVTELKEQLNSVEIETINRCNNNCSFCPVNINDDKRKFNRMTEELFIKIIDELSMQDYSGYVSLFSNNEPLLDNRIFDFIGYATKKLPNAIHALFTNGILLDEKKFNILISQLDLLFIDNYNDELTLNKNIKPLLEKYSTEDNNCKIVVYIRRKNEVLLNRGGLAPNKKESVWHYASPCILPSIQMVVRPDGKVSRCCQDAYGNETLGDLSIETIDDVWHGEKYSNYRNEFKRGNRKNLKYCNVCDQIGLINYYPKIWNKYYLNSFLHCINSRAESKKLVVLNCYDRNIERYFEKIAECQKEIHIGTKSENTFYIIVDYNKEYLLEMEKNGLTVGIDYMICDSKWFLQDNDINKMEYVENRKKINEASKSGKCICFGAGYFSDKICDEYRINVLYYIDNNARKIGQHREKEVVLPNSRDIDNDTWYLLGMKDYYEAYNQLKELGVKEDRIIVGNKLNIE